MDSQILLIINKQNNYVGTLTDGDIRRGFIKGSQSWIGNF